MIGTVVSDKTEKTVTVVVEFTRKHLLYHKIMKRSSRFLAHDDRLGAKPGDLVRILETRPLSRRKRWRVTEIIQRGEVAEIAPREIDAEYLGQPRERQPKPEPTNAPVAAAEPVDTTTEEPTSEAQVPPAVEEEAATTEAPEREAAAEQPPTEASAEAEELEPDEPAKAEEPAAEEEAPAASEEEATSEDAQEEPEPGEPAKAEEPAAEEEAPAASEEEASSEEAQEEPKEP